MRQRLPPVLVAALLLLRVTVGNAAPAQALQVTFIDVGQGDAALLRDSHGFDVLIDGGRASAGPTVAAYLREQDVDDIEVMVASHPDSDHIGGLVEVLEMADIPVESVVYGGYPGDTATWDRFVDAVAAEGFPLTPAQFPQELAWGEMSVRVLNPPPGLVDPETNDASVVLLIEHGANSFLFTGDIGGDVEADVVVRGSLAGVDILKVAEHGSAYSSSEAFLSAVKPKEAVISVGNNPYGHPAEDTLTRLQAAGAKSWRTDLNGTVWVTSDGLDYTITAEHVHLPFANLIFLPVIESTNFHE